MVCSVAAAEEADSHIFVHVADAVYKGHYVAICTVNTNVVVIAVAALVPLELWVAFGTGSIFRFIAVHEMVDAMVPEMSAVFAHLPRIYWV